MHDAAVGDAGQVTAAPERSLSLAGSIIKARYRVNAVSSVSRAVVVYAAEELRYGRPVALKVLRDDVAGDAEFVAAVREQASALAMSVHVHRGVARVYECGTTDTGELFIALERTRGATLREVLDARGALDPSTALRIASQIGEALETLHHNHVVHGQLAPDSVLVVTDHEGREHVTLVNVELSAAYRTTLGLRLRDVSRLPYLAPEQVERGETTEASDQYALGILLRELLTADTSPETTGTRTAAPALPASIERIITTALETRPEHRYPDISVMVNDMWGAQMGLAEPDVRPRSVKSLATSHRRRRPRRSHVPLRIAAAAVAATIIAAAAWVTLSDRIVSRFRARVTAPAARSTTLPESTTVKDASTAEGLAHPAAAPRPAPVVEPPAPAAAPVVESRPRRPVESRAPAERPTTTPPARDGDGSAIIDWLLKNRR